MTSRSKSDSARGGKQQPGAATGSPRARNLWQSRRRAGARDQTGRAVPPATRLRYGVIGLIGALVVGTAGFMAFGYSLIDAVFQTVITVSTVGFGEVRPFDTGQKWFTIFLILVGVGVAAYTFSTLVETLVGGFLSDELRRRRMQRQIDSLQNHLILCGWGRVGSSIARYVAASDMDVVVIDSSAERVATVKGLSLHGDATDEDVLRAAGIDRAKALVTALNGDADNLYVTLTARSMRPDLFIVARTSSESAVAKLIQGGANRVVNPQDLGGARMAALAVQPDVVEFLDVVMHDGSLEFRLEQIEVPRASPVAGETLRSARLHALTGALVLAIRHPGEEFLTNPPPDTAVAGGDVLVVIGNVKQIEALRALTEGLRPITANGAVGD